jgi:hypothetical protein
LLSKILPNATLKDFYMETVPVIENEIFISIIRRSAADEIISAIQSAGFSLVGAGLGSPSVLHILPLTGEPGPLLHFGNHQLRFREGFANEIIFDEKNSCTDEIEISGQKINGAALLAFASAFELVMNHSPGQVIEPLKEMCSDFFQRKLFRKGAGALAATLLFVLLVNFFFFSAYRDRAAALDNTLQDQGGAFLHLDTLEKQVAEKRKFLLASGLTGNARHSWYADQLAAHLPREIILTGLNIFPKIKTTEEDTIGFSPGKILIDGSCPQSIILNSWLQELKKEKWITGAELLSYLQDKNMTRGEFSVLVKTE